MTHSQYDDDLAEIKARAKAVERRQTAAFAERVARLREAPGPWSIGVAPAGGVDVGWCVWTDQMLNDRGEPRGGVIVEIGAIRQEDPETGEIVERRAFRCLDPYRLPELRWTLVAEQAVDAVERPERYRLWRCICALAADTARPGKKLDLSRTEQDRVTSLERAWRLARAVMA